MAKIKTKAKPKEKIKAKSRAKSKVRTKSKPKAKLKVKKIIYCKRCGVQVKPHFKIQLTPKMTIDVCQECFNWSLGVSQSEIKKDYDRRNRRRTK